MPLFPPPALPKQDGSLSPSRPISQLATPYSHRNITSSHPTPPSNAGDYASRRFSNGLHSQFGHSAVVPTPAPTVTSCISDEDVAIQLMRLGNANAGSTAATPSASASASAAAAAAAAAGGGASSSASASATALDDARDGFISDCGEYGDDGRSDTTELPDPLPPCARGGDPLPDSPILYPRAQNYKTLDEILPSFGTTEPSDDDENLPPSQHYRADPQPPPPSAPQLSQQQPQSRAAASLHATDVKRPATRIASDYDDESFSDEADETYVAKEESDREDADYDDDLDDVPLKTRRERERKLPGAPVVLHMKPAPQLPKGVAKMIKRQPAASSPPKPKPPGKPQPHHQHQQHQHQQQQQQQQQHQQHQHHDHHHQHHHHHHQQQQQQQQQQQYHQQQYHQQQQHQQQQYQHQQQQQQHQQQLLQQQYHHHQQLQLQQYQLQQHQQQQQHQPDYPISPASPPSSRKPSIASSKGPKSKPNSHSNGNGSMTTMATTATTAATAAAVTMQHGPGTPFSLGQPPHLFAPFEGQPPGNEPRPRCQRCRKSKKGCDRQRPCQRCKDAGVPAEECISEDEAGTRRGRQAAAAARKLGMANGIVKPKPKKKKKVPVSR